MAGVVRIIAGSYEEMIICYDLEEEGGTVEDGQTVKDGQTVEDGQTVYDRKLKEKKLKLKLTFTDHPHTGSVRCIAASKGGLVASGSSDETIHVYNANTRKDVGTLMSHNGSVNDLQFHGAKFLFSASEDANVVVWKTRPWEVLKTLRGHKGSVESLAVHPSGKIALSTGKDRSLKTWNLIKGRSAYVTNIKHEGSRVQWSPSGKFYAVIVASISLKIYDVATAFVAYSHDQKKRINSFVFLSDDLLALGGEGKELVIVSITKAKCISTFEAHEARVKDICLLDSEELNKMADEETWRLATASNDGWIKVWDLRSWNDSNVDSVTDASVDSTDSPKDNPSGITAKLLCQINSGLRISCLCSYVRKGGKVEEEDEQVVVVGKGKTNKGKRDIQDSDDFNAKKVKFN